MADWTVADSAELYGISSWGGDYFAIDPDGGVVVQPAGPDGARVSLPALVEELRGRGQRTPLLIRFSDVLASRVREIAGCFERAFRECEYAGSYRGVYPIKVNQQRQVVEELVEYGRSTHLGLEVGSKPELLVALALIDHSDALIVCNGYKDRGYLEIALLGQRLGRRPVVVLDRPQELETLIKVSRELGIRPHIGVRARLSARGAGKWSDSTGERSKFGLTVSEIVGVIARLRAESMLDCLEMLHFHIGSQITEIRAHTDALREASRIFTGLYELGAHVRYLDVGGGLGVDYDGSQSSGDSSMNYSVQEYAYDVVAAIREACDERRVPHPDIVTECGRALVSHASLLVFDVLGVNEGAGAGFLAPRPPAEDEHKLIRELHEVWSGVTPESVQEAYHDAVRLKDEAHSAFSLGYLDLEARARVEEIFASCCGRILACLRELERVPEDLESLERELADVFYGNFSVFQSLPDSWALEQLFPLMPIHRLDERPTRRATFADLTCDSDGKIDRFVAPRQEERVLPLHEPDGRPYYVGAFLVGAYQETLGEVHNLFGDTDTVHVSISESGYSVEQVIEGDRVDEVLAYVQYDRRDLSERVRRAAESALRRGDLTLQEAALLRSRYQQGLTGYTYPERES